ncbi:MAG: hypothetical protein JW801_01435 [Bacteroidales bacterium]|nr:hypothetical protein [Bacteroidales bacterium]
MNKKITIKSISGLLSLLTVSFLSFTFTSCVEKSAAEQGKPQPVTQEFIDWEITKPPASLELDPFYKKYVYVNGIHVISSRKVPDTAIYQACNIIMAMTEALPKDILKELTVRNTRVGIMARYEGTTDIPEHRELASDTTLNWDVRARGLGGTIELPLTTCAEENLLCYQIDKYHAEDILIHEFAHTIHGVGILPKYPDFNQRLQKIMDAALADGKYENTYARTNVDEYFAEGVQDWFNVNAEVPAPDGKHNHVNTRSELKEYDPALYELIAEFFEPTMVLVSCHAVPFE